MCKFIAQNILVGRDRRARGTAQRAVSTMGRGF